MNKCDEPRKASHRNSERTCSRACFEGHRWFDLRRTTRPEIKKEIEDVTYTLVQDDSRYTLRIPQDAIDANPGLLN